MGASAPNAIYVATKKNRALTNLASKPKIRIKRFLPGVKLQLGIYGCNHLRHQGKTAL